MHTTTLTGILHLLKRTSQPFHLTAYRGRCEDTLRLARIHDKISQVSGGRDLQGHPGKEGPGAMEPGGRSGTILLVEDSDVVRAVIANMLENGGLTVLQASGGEEALALSRRGDTPLTSC